MQRTSLIETYYLSDLTQMISVNIVKFKTPYIAQQSAQKIFDLYLDYRCKERLCGYGYV